MSDNENDSTAHGQPQEAVPGTRPFSRLQVGQCNETSREYPSGFKFASTMAAVCLSFILVGLVSPPTFRLPPHSRFSIDGANQDSTILATAVPRMTRHFGTIADVGWYTSV